MLLAMPVSMLMEINIKVLRVFHGTQINRDHTF